MIALRQNVDHAALKPRILAHARKTRPDRHRHHRIDRLGAEDLLSIAGNEREGDVFRLARFISERISTIGALTLSLTPLRYCADHSGLRSGAASQK